MNTATHHPPSASTADPVMCRRVSSRMSLAITGEADLVAAVAVAANQDVAEETIDVRLDGRELDHKVIEASHDARPLLLRRVGVGELVVDYSAVVMGRSRPEAPTDRDWFDYVRPSRYCESDRLGPFARREFEGLAGRDLLEAVSSWVGSHVDYVPGSSRPTDGAVATLLGQSGVCRDYAHLTAALLRANGMPARVASVYAPGLEPMDFHAVAEASWDGSWHVVDPTCLAPRSSLLRIATGADATDTAFLTVLGGSVELNELFVSAVVEPHLPHDDLTALAELA